VVPQTGEVQGKLVGYSPNKIVFIAAARLSGHGVVYCLKKFVTRADGGKQWSLDTVK